MERGDVVPRRSTSQRYGQRPPPPPDGPRPVLRFPLDASADPQEIEKPPVRPPMASAPWDPPHRAPDRRLSAEAPTAPASPARGPGQAGPPRSGPIDLAPLDAGPAGPGDPAGRGAPGAHPLDSAYTAGAGRPDPGYGGTRPGHRTPAANDP